MKSYVAAILIVVGGLLALAPVAAHSYRTSRESEHVAEFYHRNGSSIVLPEAMDSRYEPYDWACLAAGICMVVAGCEFVRSARADGRSAIA
jgi:hypothetical protein